MTWGLHSQGLRRFFSNRLEDVGDRHCCRGCSLRVGCPLNPGTLATNSARLPSCRLVLPRDSSRWLLPAGTKSMKQMKQCLDCWYQPILTFANSSKKLYKLFMSSSSSREGALPARVWSTTDVSAEAIKSSYNRVDKGEPLYQVKNGILFEIKWLTMVLATWSLVMGGGGLRDNTVVHSLRRFRVECLTWDDLLDLVASKVSMFAWPEFPCSGPFVAQFSYLPGMILIAPQSDPGFGQ